jgi:hypothetical protein
LQSQKSLAKDGDIKNNDDETLLIIYKSKHPKKGGIQRTKMEGPTSKKTKKSTKKGEPQKDIKFSNCFLSREAYQIRKGEDLLKGHLA